VRDAIRYAAWAVSCPACASELKSTGIDCGHCGKRYQVFPLSSAELLYLAFLPAGDGKLAWSLPWA
jgi:hypothetical protein